MHEKWQKVLPRLYDIWEVSNQSSTDNYFKRLNRELSDESCLHKIEKIDYELRRLDAKAWEVLKRKTLPYVTKPSSDRAYEQLFNTLNEAKGYIYLKEQEATDIEFIDEGSDETPDISGNIQDNKWLVEVKTVRPSDEEIEYLKQTRSEFREVIDEIPNGFKNKIQSTVDKASRQLNTYDSTNCASKILFLIVNADICLAETPELRDFLDTCSTPNIDVVPTLHRWF